MSFYTSVFTVSTLGFTHLPGWSGLHCCNVFADIRVMQINKCWKVVLEARHYTLSSWLISGQQNYAKNELDRDRSHG